MKQDRYCIYNKTQNNFLSQGLVAVDTTREPFKALIADLTENAATGLWLHPFRGIPEARSLPRFDLVYLDERHCVIKGSECFSVKEFAPFSGRVASAIVLPPHTIATTGTHPGDQLKIATPSDHEMEELLAHFDKVAEAAPKPLPQAVETPVTAAGLPQRAEEEHSVLGRFLHWLLQEEKASDRRRTKRQLAPGLIAYYWNGASPSSYALKDISLNGFYLLTDERWRADTIIQMRLQRTDVSELDQEESVAVTAKVVRWGADGVGLSTIFAESAGPQAAVLNGAGTAVNEWLSFMQRLNTARATPEVHALQSH